MTSLQPKPNDKISLNIFVSYSHKDNKIVDDLLNRFTAFCCAAAGYHIDLWRDTAILPGEYWHHRITDAINICDFGLLLASPHFFASDYIRTHELSEFVAPSGQPLIQHKAAIPVFLRPMKLGLLDTRGLSAQQFYRYQDKSFYEASGAQRDLFVSELFEAMLQAAAKRNT